MICLKFGVKVPHQSRRIVRSFELLFISKWRTLYIVTDIVVGYLKVILLNCVLNTNFEHLNEEEIKYPVVLSKKKRLTSKITFTLLVIIPFERAHSVFFSAIYLLMSASLFLLHCVNNIFNFLDKGFNILLRHLSLLIWTKFTVYC